jgi:hypothetical protein
MKKLIIGIVAVVIVLGIHFLSPTYTNRTPSETTSMRIDGLIVVGMNSNESSEYYVFSGSSFHKKKFDPASTRYQSILDASKKRERTTDSLAIGPSAKFALKLEHGAPSKKIIDLKTGSVVLEVATPHQISPPWAFAWNYDGDRLAMSTNDYDSAVHDRGDNIVAILDVASKSTKYWKLPNPIQSVAWKLNSREIAVVTRSWRLVYCPVGLSMILFGHPWQYESYDLTVIDLEKGPIAQSSIVADTKNFVSGLCWTSE